MELAYRYWLVSEFYTEFYTAAGFEYLGSLQQIMGYKCFLDALREGQVFTMENTALEEMRTRNVLR